MQKMVDFYHDKGIDILKLGFALPNLAKFCLHKSTTAKFYPFTESDEDLLEKFREDMVGGPSIVFTRKAVVDKNFIRNLTNMCKSFVGNDASQLYLFSMCQAMPIGLHLKLELDSESGKLIQRQIKTRSFENMVLWYFLRVIPQCKAESFYTTGTQKKIDANSVDVFCGHCNTVFEAMGCYYKYCPCKEACAAFTVEEIQRGLRWREVDEEPKQYTQKKDL